MLIKFSELKRIDDYIPVVDYGNRILNLESISTNVYRFESECVVKVVNVSIEDLRREITIQNIASSIGVAPRVLDVFINLNDNGVIVMDYIEGVTLNKYLLENKLSDNLRLELKRVIDKLYDVGIEHRDQHGNNIIINPCNQNVIVIDYGESVYNKLYNYKRDYSIEIDTSLGLSGVYFINDFSDKGSSGLKEEAIKKAKEDIDRALNSRLSKFKFI